MKYTSIALFAALTLASAPALAGGDHHDRHHGDAWHQGDARHRGDARFTDHDAAAAHEALEHRDDLLQRRASVFRIGAVERREIADQRQQIADLQDRLEAGESIDRYTLYRALGGSEHVIYFDSDFS